MMFQPYCFLSHSVLFSLTLNIFLSTWATVVLFARLSIALSAPADRYAVFLGDAPFFLSFAANRGCVSVCVCVCVAFVSWWCVRVVIFFISLLGGVLVLKG